MLKPMKIIKNQLVLFIITLSLFGLTGLKGFANEGNNEDRSLIDAVMQGDIKKVELLLAEGTIDINLRDNNSNTDNYGKTALLTAAVHGHTKNSWFNFKQ